jgi:hypothetical protein
VPAFAQDIHDVAGLRELGAALCAPSEQTQPAAE